MYFIDYIGYTTVEFIVLDALRLEFATSHDRARGILMLIVFDH